MLLNDLNGLGRIEVTTIPMPDSVTVLTAAYTYSGSVLVTCRRKEDPDEADYYTLAVMNDDGTGFHVIFSGQIPQKKGANGIRFMPFADKSSSWGLCPGMLAGYRFLYEGLADSAGISLGDSGGSENHGSLVGNYHRAG